jgi:hypothetical protein
MDLSTIYPQNELIEYIVNRRIMASRLNTVIERMANDHKISPWMILDKDKFEDSLLIKFMDRIIYKFYRETDISNLSYEERYALDYSLVMAILKQTSLVLNEVNKLYYDKFEPDALNINK